MCPGLYSVQWFSAVGRVPLNPANLLVSFCLERGLHEMGCETKGERAREGQGLSVCVPTTVGFCNGTANGSPVG